MLTHRSNLTESRVCAKKNARGGVWAVETWTVLMDDNYVSAAATYSFLYQSILLLLLLIARCKHENKNFGTL